MSRHDSHRLYRAVIKLYPKAHREAYGEQMVQTLDDMLSDHPARAERLSVALRIALELPRTVAEEHINTIRGMNMRDFKFTNKRLTLGIGGFVVVAGVIVVALFAAHHQQYSPTTLANVPRSAHPPACIQIGDNPKLAVDPADKGYIENAVASSIIDVPAGTNVDIHVHSYDGSTAAGTAVYSGKYGSYNFIADKTASNSTNNYVGGWKITHLETCRS